MRLLSTRHSRQWAQCYSWFPTAEPTSYTKHPLRISLIGWHGGSNCDELLRTRGRNCSILQVVILLFSQLLQQTAPLRVPVIPPQHMGSLGLHLGYSWASTSQSSLVLGDTLNVFLFLHLLPYRCLFVAWKQVLRIDCAVRIEEYSRGYPRKRWNPTTKPGCLDHTQCILQAREVHQNECIHPGDNPTPICPRIFHWECAYWAINTSTFTTSMVRKSFTIRQHAFTHRACRLSSWGSIAIILQQILI